MPCSGTCGAGACGFADENAAEAPARPTRELCHLAQPAHEPLTRPLVFITAPLVY